MEAPQMQVDNLRGRLTDFIEEVDNKSLGAWDMEAIKWKDLELNVEQVCTY